MKLKQGVPPSRIMNVEGVITASVIPLRSEKYTTITNFLSSLNSDYELEFLDVRADKDNRVLMLVDREKFEFNEYIEY
jgi:hypothetical protein